MWRDSWVCLHRTWSCFYRCLNKQAVVIILACKRNDRFRVFRYLLHNFLIVKTLFDINSKKYSDTTPNFYFSQQKCLKQVPKQSKYIFRNIHKINLKVWINVTLNVCFSVTHLKLFSYLAPYFFFLYELISQTLKSHILIVCRFCNS